MTWIMVLHTLISLLFLFFFCDRANKYRTRTIVESLCNNPTIKLETQTMLKIRDFQNLLQCHWRQSINSAFVYNIEFNKIPAFQKSHFFFVCLREVHVHVHECAHTQICTHTINSERGECLYYELYIGYNYKCFSPCW